MTNKAATAGVIASLGILTGTSLLAKQAQASESPKTPGIIPTVEYILASQTMGELTIYYGYIGQLYFTGQIDRETYESLYQAYVTRFYQLTGFE